MSLNVKVHLHVMINYIVQALTEAIFPKVKSFVRDNGLSKHFIAVSLVTNHVAQMSFLQIPSAPA